jgi:hypothetical protein
VQNRVITWIEPATSSVSGIVNSLAPKRLSTLLVLCIAFLSFQAGISTLPQLLEIVFPRPHRSNWIPCFLALTLPEMEPQFRTAFHFGIPEARK